MAKEVQPKKRKASMPEGDSEKAKKVKKVTTQVAVEPVKKRKATEDPAPVVAKKTKAPKPRLPDIPIMKHAKKSDKGAEKINGDDESSKALKPSKAAKIASKELKSVKAKKSKLSELSDPTSNAEDINEEEGDDEDDDSEVDDQTEALLKGFESDGDEEDAKKDGGLKEGEQVPEIPKKSKKQLKKAADSAKDDSPGVVYVGRIPHGFYEHEMKEYFKQFGNILKLRLSRNKKTGASKHIAWIEFESATVADIVARTMDNYLLFGHILKVKVIPDEQVPANLWKGANKRFKKVPWNKMEGRKLKEPKSEEQWDKQAENVRAKRHQKAEKLKAIGYEFESPKIKSAKGVAKKAEQPALTTEEVEVKAIEAVSGIPKKKEKKEEAQLIETSEAMTEAGTAAVVKESTKPKKEKKRKVVEVEDAPAAATPVAPVDSSEKKPKTKKVKAALVDAADETSEETAKKSKKNKKAKASV